MTDRERVRETVDAVERAIERAVDRKLITLRNRTNSTWRLFFGCTGLVIIGIIAGLLMCGVQG